MGPIGALRFLVVAAAPALLVAMAPREAGPASLAVGSAGDIAVPAHASTASLSSTGDKATLAHVDSQQQYPYSSGTGASPYSSGTGASPYSSGTGASPYSSGTGASPYSSGTGASPKSSGAGATGVSRGAGGVMGGASASSSSTSSGKECIIPMWDSVLNVCVAGSGSQGKAATFKDSNKIKRTKANDGDICTVKCPGTGTLSTYMIGPSLDKMTCSNGEWTDAKTQSPVAAIECATTSQAYFFSLIFFIVVAYCGNNWYNGKPLLEGTPFGQPAAPEQHAPEVAVVVTTESTPAPEANANASAR